MGVWSPPTKETLDPKWKALSLFSQCSVAGFVLFLGVWSFLGYIAARQLVLCPLAHTARLWGGLECEKPGGEE